MKLSKYGKRLSARIATLALISCAGERPKFGQTLHDAGTTDTSSDSTIATASGHADASSSTDEGETSNELSSRTNTTTRPGSSTYSDDGVINSHQDASVDVQSASDAASQLSENDSTIQTNDSASQPPNTATEPACGDGVVTGDEECDDGNPDTRDGCSNCQVSEGFECDDDNPSNCLDINECTENLDNCDVNAECGNVPGGFTCTCNIGYDGDGKSCSNIDECTEGTDECDVRATCADTDGAYTCTCRSGYFGDGFNCEQPPSCEGLAANCGSSNNESCCASPEVSGDQFELGDPADGDTSEAKVSSFRLDKYEVTVGRFSNFRAAYDGPPSAGSGEHPLIANTGWLSAWNDIIAASRADLLSNEDAPECEESDETSSRADARLPVNCVTWYEAFAFCAWDDGRLPTEAEWELAAAGGSEGRVYPWGDATPTESLAVFNCMADGSAAGQCANADILRVGSKPAGSGRFTQLDLAGSMTEWVLDSWRAYPATCDDCAFVATEVTGQGVLRGGDWASLAANLGGRHRASWDRRWRFPQVGIRCARDL